MRHTYECPMRWADLDSLGHVNNVVYVDYLQEARVDMLRALGAPERAADPGEGLVVVRHEVSYLTPLSFDFKPVLIECWVTEIRAASFTMAYEIFDHQDPDGPEAGGRRVYARATTVLTPFVFVRERPRRITAEERDQLQRFLEPAARAPRDRPVSPTRTPLGHYRVQVRFSDVDVFGHVNNVKYLEYLQEARVQLNARVWSEAVAAGEERPSIVIAQVDVDYVVPLRFRQAPYDVWTAVSRVGSRSMTFESEILDGLDAGTPTLLARARVVVVFFDLATGRSTEPSAAIREAVLGAQYQT